MNILWITHEPPRTRIGQIKTQIARTMEAVHPAEGEDEYTEAEKAQALAEYLRDHCQQFAIPFGAINMKGAIS